MAHLRRNVPCSLIFTGLGGNLEVGVVMRAVRIRLSALPAGRLRLEVRPDKKGHPQRKEDPQKYKGNSAGTNEHRSDSHRDYLHLPVESKLPGLFESRPLSRSHQGPWPLPAGLKSCL